MEIILGVLASGLMQIIKRWVDEPWLIQFILAMVSVVLAAVYVSLVNAGMWETVVQIFMAASTFYVLVVRNAEKMLK